MKILDTLDKVGAALRGVDTLYTLVTGKTSKHSAEVLSAVEAGLASIKQGLDDKHVTAAQIDEQLRELEARIVDNDAKADAALADKFKG